jgi:hypothetical protein
VDSGLGIRGLRTAARLLPALLTVSALLGGSAAAADEPFTLEQLVSRSELVVHAVPVRLDLDARGAGSVELQPLAWLKGSVQTPTITVWWGTAPDEPRIGSLEGSWVVFLRRDAQERFVSTSPGGGLWPVESTASGRAAIRYEGAVRRVLVPTDRLTAGAAFFTPSGELHRADAVLLDDLAAFVRWMQGETPAAPLEP